MSPANNNVAAFVAGWRCAYPAYKSRRPVQAKRRRANRLHFIDFSPRKRYVFALIPAWTYQHYADYSVC